MLIVGRETSLPSGAVDLVGMARNGAILVIEFKTGPQNSDFRHALAQMVDYGSHLWEMDPDDFETTVARRYFATAHAGQASKRIESIAAAAISTWPDLTDEELAAFTVVDPLIHAGTRRRDRGVHQQAMIDATIRRSTSRCPAPRG